MLERMNFKITYIADLSVTENKSLNEFWLGLKTEFGTVSETTLAVCIMYLCTDAFSHGWL